MKFIQKEKTCCFTGHRVIAKHDFKTIKEHLENEVMSQIISIERGHNNYQMERW